MANNLLVFSLSSGTATPDIARFLEPIGDSIPLAPGWFYVSTRASAESVAETLWAAMGEAGRLVVVDAAGGTAAWFGLDAGTDKALQQSWNRNAL